MQADRGVTSVMSSVSQTSATSLLSSQHQLQALPSTITAQQQDPNTLSSMYTAHPSTTNICLYPPPNPLAKPILPNTPGLSRLVPFSPTTLSTQPGHGARTWQHKTNTGGLGSVNEKTIPAYQVRPNHNTDLILHRIAKLMPRGNKPFEDTEVIEDTENLLYILDLTFYLLTVQHLK